MRWLFIGFGALIWVACGADNQATGDTADSASTTDTGATLDTGSVADTGSIADTGDVSDGAGPGPAACAVHVEKTSQENHHRPRNHSRRGRWSPR